MTTCDGPKSCGNLTAFSILALVRFVSCSRFFKKRPEALSDSSLISIFALESFLAVTLSSTTGFYLFFGIKLSFLCLCSEQKWIDFDSVSYITTKGRLFST